MNLPCFQRWARLGVITVLSLTLEANAWIIETPLEFVSEGDFDGDGRLDAVVLDKQTGSVRVGFQDASTQLNWQPAFASGMANATSLAVGRVSSNAWDSIAVASPGANRVNKLDPRQLLSTNGLSPVSIYPPGIGPELVAALDAGGAGNTALDDFFITTRENPEVRYALLRNTGATTSTLDESTLTRSFSSANAFEVKSAQGKRLGGLLKVNRFGFSDYFQVLDFSSGVVVTRLNFEMPISGAEFVAHRFGSNNPLAQVLFFQPGDHDLTRYQFQETAGGFALGGSNRFRIDEDLQQLRPLPLTAGGRLLGLFGNTPTNLTTARIYAFDGTNAPVVVQTFTGVFSAALVLGNGNLALLNADATGRSASHQVLLASGSNYVLGSTGTLPAINRFSGAANALLFDVEPFVNAAARPRQLQRHADWSTALRVTPTVRVTGEQFQGASNGLGAASSRDFGAPLSGVTTGLVNQYIPSLSIFSGRDALGAVEGDLRIAPPAGHYAEAQRLSLTLNAAGTWLKWYRTSSSQDWSLYTGSILIFSNATVEFYARRITDGVLTPIGRAAYSFSEPLGELDSDHDGVPDYVEQTRGLDPRGGPDSDRDGFTDLEELARGTDPLEANSKPGSNAALRNAFTRLVTPRPPHPVTGNATKVFSDVSMQVHNFGGVFLAEAATSPFDGTGITNPAARFNNLVPNAGARLIAETTPAHFDIVAPPDSRVGRELIGLVPVPPTNNFSVNYLFSSGSLAAETANWIAAASNAVATATNPVVAGLLTTENALVAALYERHAANALLTRGTNGATNATLFPFRGGDASRQAITAADLRNLEQYLGVNAPGYRQETVFHFLDGQVRGNASLAVLTNLARELWRISAAQNGTNIGSLPYDELRALLANQALSSNYATSKSIATNLATARTLASNLMASIPPRPRTNLTVLVAAIPLGAEPIRVQTPDGKPVTLWQFDGRPFAFPPNLQLLPGSELSLFAHTDLPTIGGALAWEVISLNLTVLPMPSASDADGNLLVDSWEELFFGQRGADAFGDADGDGYSNLEEMLAGTQPDDALFAPGGPPYALSRPAITLSTQGGQLKFGFTWPDGLIGSFQFGLEASDLISGPYVLMVTPPLGSLGGNRYELQAPLGTDPAKFYRLTLRLSE